MRQIAPLLPRRPVLIGLLLTACICRAAHGQDCVSWLNRCGETNDYDKRIEYSNKALAAHPACGDEDRGKVHYNRGTAYFLKKDQDRALADLTDAVRFAPAYGNAWLNLGVVKAEKGWYREALEDYDRALAVGVEDPSLIYAGRGHARAKLGDVPGAIADYDASIRINPRHGGHYEDRGRLYYSELKDKDKALADFNKALELDPNLFVAYTLRGTMRMMRGDMAGAIADSKKAAAMQPQDADSWGTLADMANLHDYHAEAAEAYDKEFALRAPTPERLYKRGVSRLNLGKHAEALADFSKVPRGTSKTEDLAFYLAESHRAMKNYSKAHEVLRGAIRSNPKDASLRKSLGNLYADEKRYAEAREAYELGIKLSPVTPGIRVALARLLASNKELDEAVEVYSTALELDPGDTYARSQRGHAYFELNKWEEAVSDYDRVLSSDPKHNLALSGRAMALFQRGKHQEALAAFDKLILVEDSRASYYAMRGTIRQRFGQYEQAVADYDKAISLGSNSNAMVFMRASANFSLGRLKAALADYEVLVSSESTEPRFHSGRGRVLAALGETDKAAAAYEKSLELKPTATAYAYRGFLLFARGRLDDADRDFEKALKLAPQDAFALSGLAIVRYKLGKRDDARNLFGKATTHDPRLTKDFDGFVKRMRLTSEEEAAFRLVASAFAKAS